MVIFSSEYNNSPRGSLVFTASLCILMKVTGSAMSTFFVGDEKEFSILALNLTLPSRPSLVVTKITPLAPLAPYSDVAVASFITEKLAISSVFNLARSSVPNSIPSINISGSFFASAPNVVIPRMKKLALSCPGSPVV